MSTLKKTQDAETKESAITAGLSSLKTILEGAAEQAAYGALLQALIAMAPKWEGSSEPSPL